MGHYYDKRDSMWRVRFRINGKQNYFGSFKTEEEAKIFSKIKSEEIMISSFPIDISEYRDIIGYSGYKISKDGRVFSLRRTTLKKIIPAKQSKGYLYLHLYNDGKSTNELLHRLIYKTFIGEIPDNMFVDHIDRNKSNNSLDNLRLVTASQNSINSNNVDEAKGYHKSGDYWQAVICSVGKRIYLGNFKTQKEARLAYLKAKEKYHIMP